LKSERVKKNSFVLFFLAGLFVCALSSLLEGMLNLRSNQATPIFLSMLFVLGLGIFVERQRHRLERHRLERHRLERQRQRHRMQGYRMQGYRPRHYFHDETMR
jgi:hypothetical protein